MCAPPGGRSPASRTQLAAEERELKRFLYARLYDLPELEAGPRRRRERVVADLAAAYRADPALLPPDWQRGGDAVEQLRTIGDFIAGMTDRFAIARHEELVGPVNLPPTGSSRFARRCGLAMAEARSAPRSGQAELASVAANSAASDSRARRRYMSAET